MAVNDALGTRMKVYYENIPKTKLMRRTPVAIRLDGKAFHTFTRGFQKPFDEILISTMQRTMKALCEDIQGCVFGYTQSDEITLILVDYKNLDTAAWFDYEVQKVCSISASMATLYFNKFFEDEIIKFQLRPISEEEMETKTGLAYEKKLQSAAARGAMFDARCFNIPKEEVANLLYWRQLDATRNSIQMVGQANFSHKELDGVSCKQIQNKLLTEKDINWNNYPTYMKRGSCCYKDTSISRAINGKYEYKVTTEKWVLDLNPPIFKDNWEYINKHIYV